ncbi:hypothetical protein LSH36_2700g00001, partial [Paralvinella palmiformis]
MSAKLEIIMRFFNKIKMAKIVFLTMNIGLAMMFVYLFFSATELTEPPVLRYDIFRNRTKPTSDLLKRGLTRYNKLIEGSRTKLLEHLASSKTRDFSCVSSNVSVADGQSSNYFKTIEAFPEIMTVFYEDSMDNISNVLRRNYYDYMSNDCNLLEINSKGGNYFGRKHYGAECRKTFHETWHGHLLKDLALGIGLPGNITPKNKQSRIVTFLHLIAHGISFNDGDVLYGNLKIVPQKCGRILKT